jgi:hypothetical protein
MNLQEFPKIVKEDVEDQSLSILEMVKDDIIVVGGWAVRALVDERHARYTLDVDGVVAEERLSEVWKKIEDTGLEPEKMDWGTRFFRKYEPGVEITDRNVSEQARRLQIRIDISGPRIPQRDTEHYFEFSLDDFVLKELGFHGKKSNVTVKVPPARTLAASKLGLPRHFKHRFDSAVLLEICDVDEVIETIRRTDAWYEMVLKTIPKQKGRMARAETWEEAAFLNAGISARDYVRKLEYIETVLSE